MIFPVAMPTMLPGRGIDWNALAQPRLSYGFVRPTYDGVWLLDALSIGTLERSGVRLVGLRVWQVVGKSTLEMLDRGMHDAMTTIFAAEEADHSAFVGPNVLSGPIGHAGEWALGAARLTLTPQRLLVITLANAMQSDAYAPSLVARCTELEARP